MTLADIAAALGAAPTKYGTYALGCPHCHTTRAVTLYEDEGSHRSTVQLSCACRDDAVRDTLEKSFVNGERPHLLTHTERLKPLLAHDKERNRLSLIKHLLQEGGLGDVRPFGAAMINLPVEPTPVLVADLIPYDCVTIITGDGGAGKGITMQTLCTTVAALGVRPFMGRAVNHRSGKALFLTGEDTDQQLRNRQARICHALGVDEHDVADNLLLHSTADREFCLWRDGKPTDEFRALDHLLEVEAPDVAVLDSASTMYDDEEISRRRVSAFVRALNQLAMRRNCAILLITHTSRSSDDSVARMTSGSTAWVYQARAALQLKATDDGDTTLTLLKSNHIKPGLKLELRWSDDGVLMAKDAPNGTVENLERHADDEVVFAEIKARWEGDTDPLSKSPRSEGGFLPAYMARTGKLKFNRAAAAMYRLLDAGRIVNARKGAGGMQRGLRPSLQEKK